MTREEAIKILSNRDDFGIPKGYTSGYAEANDMAIRSLEAWDSVIDKVCQFLEPENPTLVVTMRIDHFINIINEHLKEVEDDKRRSG